MNSTICSPVCFTLLFICCIILRQSCSVTVCYNWENYLYQVCDLLQHLCDCQLQHRVEAIVKFAHEYTNDLRVVGEALLYMILHNDAVILIMAIF